ncbi:MAG: oxygen-independent coproporphyrinogen III oxidase [Proteobacteria bacterium]|nr:oxygen-independent coproporphyrinogen III oxidase [Pseudomonadota bacterium]
MDRTLLERYDKRVPRYTSYPTAPHFHPGINAAVYERWLAEVGDDTPLSLYFHVPFCHEMCWYCGCHTKIVRRYQPVGDYAATMADEVTLIGGLLEARPPVTHMHWGGGTPTILSAEDLEHLMSKIRAGFNVAPDAEIAVEMDPRTMTEDRVQALARAGVNRASLGVQDFNDKVQKAINRIQPYEMTAQVVEWLRAAGIEAINFDLMYGLPYQTVEDVQRTVDLAAKMRPDRVAVFGYAHVPWMKTHMKMIPDESLPDAWQRFEQAEAAAERLAERGYRRIGLDHYALETDSMTEVLDQGRLRRNFQGYTTDEARALIGFGASSIGALPQGYVQNAVPLRAWAKAVHDGRPAVDKGIALSDEDRLRRDVIERLMCDMEVDLSVETARYGKTADSFRSEIEMLEPMIADGIATIDGDRISITEPGRPLMRAVCALFDTYLDTGVGRHSQAV